MLEPESMSTTHGLALPVWGQTTSDLNLNVPSIGDSRSVPGASSLAVKPTATGCSSSPFPPCVLCRAACPYLRALPPVAVPAFVSGAPPPVVS